MPEDLSSLDATAPLPRGRRYGKPIVVVRKRPGYRYTRVRYSEALASASRAPHPPIRKVKLRSVEEIHTLSESSGESFRINRAASTIYRTLPTSIHQTNWRRLQILAAAIYYFAASGWLWFLNATNIQVTTTHERKLRNGKRLREIVERLEEGFIKVGQQLALRSDLLPPEFCDELDQLYDNTALFPVEQAITAIERQAGGRRIKDIFLDFDEKPIGSASLGCVYLVVLKNGDRVAVKVRHRH